MSSSLKLPECYSLFGEPLYKHPIGLWLPSNPVERDGKIKQLNTERIEAFKEWQSSPEDPDKLLWYARKTEILGNFNEAIAIYSKGIDKWPLDPRFPRFRGHRFAIIRRLDLAVSDLERASELIQGKPDELEIYASGGPSKDKMGFSSFHWNVWYHLGFSRFAAHDLKGAIDAYRRCMALCDTPESVVATTHWLYMPLIRLGLWDEARELVEKISVGQKLVEVGDYYETILVYKGASTIEELLNHARKEGGSRFLTRAQAVGNYYLAKVQSSKAVEVFREMINTGEWTSGVYLLAESELKKLGSRHLNFSPDEP